MIKVLFVCHGNICRSPMSEFILRDMVAKRGIADQFEIASAATSREEIGNPVYPPAVRKLREHGIDPSGKRARQMTKQDYEYYDYLLAAEQYNIQICFELLAETRSIKSIVCWITQTSARYRRSVVLRGFRNRVPGHRGGLRSIPGEFQINKNDSEAAESIADAFLRMACEL